MQGIYECVREIGWSKHLTETQQIEMNKGNSLDDEYKVQIRKIFDKYDTDNDSLINVEELKELLAEQLCPDIPVAMATYLVNIYDEEGSNGTLNFEKFKQLFHLKKHSTLIGFIDQHYSRHMVPERDQKNVYNITPRSFSKNKKRKFHVPPLTMIILSVAEIVAFLIYQLWRKDATQSFLVFNPRKRKEIWRFITYMFVHTTGMHLVMNLVAQIFLGTALELKHYWWRVAVVYLAGVAAGSMGTSIVTPTRNLAGASAGVYALIAAQIATVIINFSDLKYGSVQLLILLVYCFTDLGSGVFDTIHGGGEGIGYSSHFFGGLAGLLVGIGVLRNLNEKPWERKVWYIAVTLYLILILVGTVFLVFVNDDYFNER